MLRTMRVCYLGKKAVKDEHKITNFSSDYFFRLPYLASSIKTHEKPGIKRTYFMLVCLIKAHKKTTTFYCILYLYLS